MKESRVYHLRVGQSKGPPAMKAYDWFKEKQFYQVLFLWKTSYLENNVLNNIQLVSLALRIRLVSSII